MITLAPPHQRLAAEPVPAAPAAPRRRRSRAKPRPARARIVVRSELRACGGFVTEQALLDRSARPAGSVVEWVNRLAAELDVPDAGQPASYGELLWAMVAISRAADADPERPLVALPPAAAA